MFTAGATAAVALRCLCSRHEEKEQRVSFSVPHPCCFPGKQLKQQLPRHLVSILLFYFSFMIFVVPDRFLVLPIIHISRSVAQM